MKASRRAVVCLAVTIAAFVFAAAAGGSDQRAATLEASLTGAADLHMTWADPGEENGKPQQVHKLVLAFPVGTRIDTAAFARCKASDDAIKAKGAAACPRASRLGTGKSIATTGPALIKPDVVLINARREIIIVVLVNKAVFAVYRDDVTRSTVTVNFALPAVVSLLDLRIHIPGHIRAGHRYFHTPPSCPAAGSWSMTATSSYADGSMQNAPAAVDCMGSESG